MTSGESKFKIIIEFVFRTMINMLFVLGIFQGFLYSYHFSYKLFADVPYKPATTEMMNITIEPGSNAMDVAKLLDDLQVVDGEYLVLARMYLGKYNSKIQAGTYELGPSMTPDEICRCICGIKSEET
ncbi:MAG: hypothetical protein IJ232_00970 [Lachnospiraceae bacterium]|nr:hypothetical protein [Lachnospiraceae bacterium]